MTDTAITPPPTSLAQLSTRLVDDVRDLDAELAEVDLLVNQAKTEAARHVARRAAAADKLAALQKGGSDPKDLLELSAQLVTLTKRAALMESQVDVLEGKRRALGRYREAVAGYAAETATIDPSSVQADDVGSDEAPELDSDDPMPAAVSRMVMAAQEDLRREISRAMHDGPAQSLTNIVLQAQIVERLVARDPASAHGEVMQLIAMVQQTLDATKSFIFDVRPMVLDDLGLLPTLRRAARERGRRAGIAIEFDSMGQDRRLPMDLESGLFRIVDEALAAYLSLAPDRVSLKLEWTGQVEVRVAASKTPLFITQQTPPPPAPEPKKKGGKEVADEIPPALAAMIEERMAQEREEAETARLQAIVILPANVWRETQTRAASIGVTAELIDEGAQLVLVTESAAPDPVAPEA
jgi:two-component system sensor histidine kinase DegS